MKLMVRAIAASLALLMLPSAWADGDAPDWMKGAAGAAVGGVVGNQMGNGRGRTMATAAGAATGAVIGSGCKPTVTTVVGAFLGGLVGSQFGGGNGKHAVAGAGAAVGAVAGSDCSHNDSGPVSGYLPSIGRTVLINGMPMVEVSPDQFPQGKFKGFPRIQRKSDYQTLDHLTRSYAAAAKQAAAKGDPEGFMVNRYLGMRIAEWRLHTKLVTIDFVNSLAGSKTATGVLAPGSTIFLPAFSRYSDGALAANDAYQKEVLASAVNDVDWNAAPKIAGLDGLVGIFQSAAGVLTGRGVPPSISSLANIPVGAVFSAKNQAGDSFLVERTPEGFNIGNPNGRPVSIPLSKFGFIPDMPVPNAVRSEAGELVKRMQEVRHDLFWKAMQNRNGVEILSSTSAPNRVVILHSPQSAALDENGNVAADAYAATRGEVAYKKNPAYRMALEMADYKSHRREDFKAACFKTNAIAYDTDYFGSSSEILRHECLEQGRQTAYFQDYYVKDGKTMQTAESLLQDKAIAARLLIGDTARDVVEGVVGFIPVLGNVDSASKCISSTSLSAGSIDFVRKHLSSDVKFQPFVTDLLPNDAEDSAAEKYADRGLACASIVPVLGNAAKVSGPGVKAIGNLGQFGGVLNDWLISDKGTNAMATFSVVGDILATKTGERIDQLANVSDVTKATFKNFYSDMQSL